MLVLCPRWITFRQLRASERENYRGELLPHGAIIVDLSSIPLERWDSSTLCDYCRYRGLNISNKSSIEIIEIVNRAIRSNVEANSLRNNEYYPPDCNSIDNIVCRGPVRLKPFDDYVLSLIRYNIPKIDSIFLSEAHGNAPKNEMISTGSWW